LDGTIAAADLATSSVTTTQILDGTIAAADLATSSVTTTQILDGTIVAADIATGNVTTTQILDSTIATVDLADSSVTTAKIVDGTITSADLASSLSMANVISGNLVASSTANLMGLMYPTANGSANQFLMAQGNGHMTFGSANAILNSSTVSSLNLTGGSIDGASIGATTAASGNFTTLNFTSSLTGTSGNFSSNLIVGDNLTTVDLSVTGNSMLGDSTGDTLWINATVQGRASGGNVWFMGNLISSANTYSLGTKSTPWASIYAINLVTTSDKRNKKDIKDIGYGLDALMSLRPVSYEWRDMPNQKRTLGLLAQEVSDVIDEVVVEEGGDYNALGIQYQNLIPVLIKAIQEQQNEIEDRDLENKKLHERLISQEERLKKLESSLLK
jgi:hypothetical protein